MTPGPTLIKKCTSCNGLFKQSTIGSGNTFRAKFWTDGKMQASMMPSRPAAVLCPHCQTLLWLSELETVGEISDWFPTKHDDPKFKELPHYDDLQVDHYWSALTSSKLDKQKERYLRFRLLHLFNDDRRLGEERPYNHRELENMSSFIELLTEDDDQSVLLKAELLRSLGRFKEALTTLERDFDYDYGKPAELIYTLALNEDCFVKQIPKDDGELADRWRYRREEQGSTALPFDPSGPPLFHIESKDVWIKIHGMLQQSWAILEPHADGKATVYFFHDCGSAMMRLKQYSRLQMRNRYAVVDSLEFNSISDAVEGLERNSFRRHGDGPMVGLGEMPKGNYYDARATEERCYSQGEDWIHGDGDE